MNPFQKLLNSKKIDPRVSILKKYIKQNLSNRSARYEKYDRFIYFWDKIEKYYI